MKTILAFYLVFFRGYSVMRLAEHDEGEWGAANDELHFDYTHNGKWGVGDTPQDAVWDCWKKVSSST